MCSYCLSADALGASFSGVTTLPGPCIAIDLHSPAWNLALESATLFRRRDTVTARPAVEGEEVATHLCGNIAETVNVAREGDFIVSREPGESWIVPGDKFRQRYRETSSEGIFDAVGMVRAIPNPTDAPVSLIAPWGEEMVGDENCWLVEVVDPENPHSRTDDRYLVAKGPFLASYRACF